MTLVSGVSSDSPLPDLQLVPFLQLDLVIIEPDLGGLITRSQDCNTRIEAPPSVVPDTHSIEPMLRYLLK